MKIVLVSIKLRSYQFLAALVFILSLTLFYTLLGFLFFNDHYIINDKNVCNNVFSCFLYFIHNGIRGEAGFDFDHKYRYEAGYILDFVLEWLFYFSIILVMLNIINGIIVDTFDEMRQRDAQKNDFKKNYCFLCSLKKNHFEYHTLDFKTHKKKEHNLMYYYFYFIYLNNKETENKNQIENYISNCLTEKFVDFFPIKRSLNLENQKVI